jgi:hypothetical protein
MIVFPWPSYIDTIAWRQFGAWMPQSILESTMAASSVTGTGPGESFGKYKPQNNGSCGCTSPASTEGVQVVKRKKTGCFVGYSSGGVVRYNQRSSSVQSKSCF